MLTARSFCGILFIMSLGCDMADDAAFVLGDAADGAWLPQTLFATVA
jgi:hypothetical protein